MVSLSAAQRGKEEPCFWKAQENKLAASQGMRSAEGGI